MPHTDTSVTAFPDHRILVIEDDEFQRAALVTSLKRLGSPHVIQAADGAEALLHMQHERFDIVICDLQMAGVDGIEFIRRASTFPMAFILLSALDHDLLQSAKDLAREHGVFLLGALAKPLDFQQLEALLNQFDAAPRPNKSAFRAEGQRATSVAELALALDRQEFVPFFQPKVDLTSLRPTGAEVLARWAHPQAGILPPWCFIETMEQNGLIDRLTESLIRQAFQTQAAWQQAGIHIDLALNMSALSLQDVAVPTWLCDLAGQYGIHPGSITIELTETELSANFKGLLESITRLRMNGFGIALDDFGTGYSTLQLLARVPFTEVKIDRSFVAGVQQNARSALMVESIVAMLHKLEMRIVVEGIETTEELAFIRTLGCNDGQGFFFSQPLAARQFTDWHQQALQASDGTSPCNLAYSA